MFRGVGNVGLDQDGGIILGVDGKGVAIVGLTMFLNVLFDKPLLVYLVNNGLAIGDEGSHCEGDVS